MGVLQKVGFIKPAVVVTSAAIIGAVGFSFGSISNGGEAAAAVRTLSHNLKNQDPTLVPLHSIRDENAKDSLTTFSEIEVDQEPDITPVISLADAPVEASVRASAADGEKVAPAAAIELPAQPQGAPAVEPPAQPGGDGAEALPLPASDSPALSATIKADSTEEMVSRGGAETPAPTAPKKPEEAVPKRAEPSYTFEVPTFDDPLMTAPKWGLGSRSDRDYSLNDTLQLDTYRCSSHMFPGARMPVMNKTTVTVVSEYFDGGVLQRSPHYTEAQRNNGTAKACAIMNLTYSRREFLFRSEVALRNEKYGLVLWTGMRGLGSSTDKMMHTQLVYHLAFYEKTRGAWSLESAFSWGSRNHATLIKSRNVIFTFPDNSRITMFPNRQDGGKVGYAGMWEEGQLKGSVPALTLDSVPHSTNVFVSNDFPFSTTNINGYDREVRSFYHETGRKGSGKWNWTRVMPGGRYSTSIDARTPVEDWYRAFREKSGYGPMNIIWYEGEPKRGTWTKMADYCDARKSLAEDQRSGSICFVKKEAQ